MKNLRQSMKLSLSSLLFLTVTLLGNMPFARALQVEFEKNSVLPIAYINVAIKRGAVTDPAHLTGLTNFMGEMLLRGTAARTKEQVDLALDQMGARLEVDTRAESLVLRGAVLASQLSPFLQLVKEIITRPSFPENEIRKLKSEIISSIQEGLGHDKSLAHLKFNQFLFKDHPYGKPILGRTKDISKVTSATLKAHYDRLFQEENFLVLGTGDVEEGVISKWAHELAALKPNLSPSPLDQEILADLKAPEDSSARRLLIIDKPDRTQTQIYIGQVGILMRDPLYFPLYVGNYVFGGPSFSATLMTEIRVKRGWSYGASSGFRHGLQPRSWSTYLFPASKDTADALTHTLKLIEDLKQKGVTQEAFEFTKQSLIHSAGFMYNTPGKRIENKLLEQTLNLPSGFFKNFASEVEKVTLEKTNLALAQFLKPHALAIGVLGTASELKSSLIKASGVLPKNVEVISYTSE